MKRECPSAIEQKSAIENPDLISRGFKFYGNCEGRAAALQHYQEVLGAMGVEVEFRTPAYDVNGTAYDDLVAMFTKGDFSKIDVYRALYRTGHFG